MRIFLLPVSTRQALVYCQRITPKPAAQISWADKITNKAAYTWAKWEAAEKGWQKKIVEYGNRGLQRIPYQEWGLKSFPASNPKIQAEQLTEGKKFDVVYPDNVMQSEDVPKVLARLARERKNLHYQRFVGSLVALPFTIPFALIPIIPNIPFFYVAYRAWSHWKAMKGSDHLDFILDHKLFRPTSTKQIEHIYDQSTAAGAHRTFTFITAKQVEEGDAPKEELLLPLGSHTIVAQNLEVPELSTEVERAVLQIKSSIEKDEEIQKQNEKIHEEQERQEREKQGEETPKGFSHQRSKVPTHDRSKKID